ncbi:hypothetical protein GXM_04074 [Nostoc sphaeroides CCNUC1]|uniref:ABC transporter permease n=1 Tax=Nostoc sphaeroides CCNUC1 TaxID=2653204 RepID=A0A5P8W1L7_9NOSO|nr:hypothetical protein GXM_04074 [Nostoc sphaeroides CCNUC1]
MSTTGYAYAIRIIQAPGFIRGLSAFFLPLLPYIAIRLG